MAARLKSWSTEELIDNTQPIALGVEDDFNEVLDDVAFEAGNAYFIRVYSYGETDCSLVIAIQ